MAEPTIEQLQKENEELKKKLAIYEKDPAKRGYFALAHIVNQQIDVVREFNLKKEISSNPKEDKFYDRSKAIWEGLKSMLLELRALRIELKIGENETEDDTPFIETIAQQRR